MKKEQGCPGIVIGYPCILIRDMDVCINNLLIAHEVKQLGYGLYSSHTITHKEKKAQLKLAVAQFISMLEIRLDIKDSFPSPKNHVWVCSFLKLLNLDQRKKQRPNK